MGLNALVIAFLIMIKVIENTKWNKMEDSNIELDPFSVLLRRVRVNGTELLLLRELNIVKKKKKINKIANSIKFLSKRPYFCC